MRVPPFRRSLRLAALLLLVPVVLAVPIVGGCALRHGPASGGTAADAPITPVSAEEAAAVAAIKPLPRIAEDHPAPKDTPNLDQAETAQSQNPNGPKENLALAFAYYKANAFADAAPAFAKAARLQPKDPTPLLYLGYTQMAAGALTSSVTTFEQVISLPNVSRDIQSEAYLQIGNALGAEGKDEKAIAAFSKSIGANPKQGLASLALGAWAAQHKRYDQAKDFLTDATRDLPQGRHRAQAYAALGKIAEARKDNKTAQAEYHKAITDDEDNTWAQDGLKRLGGTAGNVSTPGKKG